METGERLSRIVINFERELRLPPNDILALTTTLEYVRRKQDDLYRIESDPSITTADRRAQRDSLRKDIRASMGYALSLVSARCNVPDVDYEFETIKEGRRA